jgi:hypothetical protein
MGKNNPLALHQRNFAGKTADGRDVYHCLRWCNRIQREFWFTLKPGGVSGESRGDMRWQFDARKLPEKYLPDASQQDLDVGRYPPGTRPIDWVMAALNDGWEPPLHPPVFDLAADLDNAIGLPQNDQAKGREHSERPA